MNPLDMPIDDFTASLPKRARNCIKANFWSSFETDGHLKPPHTVRHLMMFSRKEIRGWPNLGKKSLNEIEEQLRSLGLQLWEEHDDRSLYPLIHYEQAAPKDEPVNELLLSALKGYHDNSVKEDWPDGVYNDAEAAIAAAEEQA